MFANTYSLVVFLLTSTYFITGYTQRVSDLNHLQYYEEVEPIHVGVHYRNRRDLSTIIPGEKDEHLEETSFSFSGLNRNFLLHLYKNKVLIPDFFSRIYQNRDGTYHHENGIENCYYHGYLGNRDVSSAAVSTCSGLKGVIRDEDGEEFHIEPHPMYFGLSNNRNSSKHILYKSRDIIVKESFKCGFKHADSMNYTEYNAGSSPFLISSNLTEHKRARRSTSGMKYIEVLVLLDNLMFKKHGSVNSTEQRAFQILNMVDAVYKTMNTRVAVVNMVVWNVYDMVTVSTNAGDTLGRIEKYSDEVLRSDLGLKFDNLQLITLQDWKALAGLAGVGVMCSRTSAAVNRDHSTSPTGTANTIAHEMGHNIGFLHNTGACNCPEDPCVMVHTAPSSHTKSFSDCVHLEYHRRLGRGDLPCLLDYPEKLYDVPKCGNGYVEEGEECDCGSEFECEALNSTKCCNFITCKLRANAECATGPCCEGCKFKDRGILCRQKMNEECDLEEYCTGRSSNCPGNFYVQDGVSCLNDTSYCYQGSCKTHDTQCEMLWGPNAMRAQDICFQINSKSASDWGNCGKDENDQYKKCAEEDELCGKLQCTAKSPDKPLPVFPVIGSGRSRKKVTYYIGNEKVTCIQGKTTLAADLDDPTLAGPGIKCGNNSVCLKNKCINISSLSYIKRCTQPCMNGGVCNNNGNCHCPIGYACPYCMFAGPGGSADSGQGCVKEDKCEDCLTPLAKGMMILFLLVVPLIAITTFLTWRNQETLRSKCCGNNSSGKFGSQPVSSAKVENAPPDTAGKSNAENNANIEIYHGNLESQSKKERPPVPPKTFSPLEGNIRPGSAKQLPEVGC